MPSITMPSFPTAPVSAFNHAPLKGIWAQISVINYESKTAVEIVYEEDGRKYFWYATILTVAGYFAVMQYHLPHSHLDTFCVNLLTKRRFIYACGRCTDMGIIIKVL